MIVYPVLVVKFYIICIVNHIRMIRPYVCTNISLSDLVPNQMSMEETIYTLLSIPSAMRSAEL
jgi:hypothetical protein